MDINEVMTKAAANWSRTLKAESHAEWADRRIDELEAQAKRLKWAEARIEVLEKALHSIEVWADAYPLEAFTEQDWQKARALLEAGGMTLGGVTSSVARCTLAGIKALTKVGYSKPAPQP